MERHVTDKLSVKLRLKAADVAAVVIRAVFELWAFVGNSSNDVLGVCVHQFDRVDGEVLVEVGTALGRVRTQVTLIFPLFCRNKQMSIYEAVRNMVIQVPLSL